MLLQAKHKTPVEATIFKPVCMKPNTARACKMVKNYGTQYLLCNRLHTCACPTCMFMFICVYAEELLHFIFYFFFIIQCILHFFIFYLTLLLSLTAVAPGSQKKQEGPRTQEWGEVTSQP